MADFLETYGADLALTLGIVVVAIVVWLALRRFGARAAGRYAQRDDGRLFEERRQRAETVWTVARRLLAIALIVTVALTVMSVWDIPIAPLLAAGTVVGVAVGFGAQSLVADVIAGFFIIIENQYALGDVVEIAGVSGTVEDIQLRVTVLRDLKGNVHYVPNGQIQVSSNFTQDFSRIVVDVDVSYDTDVELALASLESELEDLREDWSERILEAPEILGVNALAASGVTLRGVLKALPDARWQVKREALRRVKQRFDREGIEIPFQTTTVHIKDSGTR